MDWRFRRSGAHLYMPMCPNCEACQPLRVDVSRFIPRHDQRRCWKRNSDLSVAWHDRGLDAERLALYGAYQRAVHGHEPAEDAHEFLIADGGVPGGELHARDRAGRLVAVSICDRVGDALSSVYCYYAPDQSRRALGTFMVLSEIDHCRRHDLRWLYLGFHVEGCGKMAYKSRFFPHEILVRNQWQRAEAPSLPTLPGTPRA